jgi:hypothetical protein
MTAQILEAVARAKLLISRLIPAGLSHQPDRRDRERVAGERTMKDAAHAWLAPAH